MIYLVTVTDREGFRYRVQVNAKDDPTALAEAVGTLQTLRPSLTIAGTEIVPLAASGEADAWTVAGILCQK